MAVIDIGSNSVRLVVFDGGRRVPTPLINEKVSARLGRNLQEDGRLPEKAMRTALQALSRFAAIVEAMHIDDPIVVATAAVRDAENGEAFLAKAAETGLRPRVLSGAEEARASADGVLCAFPDASGLVADLGGGSLELTTLDGGIGITMPIGTLRVPHMRGKGPRSVAGVIEQHVARDLGKGQTLFIVGGAWRALTHFAMHDSKAPLSVPHGWEMGPGEPAHLVNVLSHLPVRRLLAIPGVSSARAPALSDAALVLAALARRVQPACIVTSAFGLREGLVFRRLPDAVRAEDPLISSLSVAFGPGDPGSIFGKPLAEWAAALFDGLGPEQLRLIEAASLLAPQLHHGDRSHRLIRALELALHEPLVGIATKDRGIIGAILAGFGGSPSVPQPLERFAPPAVLEPARLWGAVMRMGDKVSAGQASILREGRLTLAKDRLAFVTGDGSLYSDTIRQHHEHLAEQLGVTAELRLAT